MSPAHVPSSAVPASPDASTSIPFRAFFFGIVAPVTLLALDPIVFRSGSGFWGPAILGQYRPAAWVSIVTCVAVFCASLRFRGRGGAWCAAAAGFHWAAAGGALAIGAAIFPYAGAGMIFFGVGLLGFVPFLTAYVYFDRGRRLFGESRGTAVRPLCVLIGATAALLLPWTIHRKYAAAEEEAIAEIRSADPAQYERGVVRLSAWYPLCDPKTYLGVYMKTQDEVISKRMEEAFERIFHEDISHYNED